jgi:hypothetical protein
MMSIAYMGMYASYAGGRLVPLGGALTFRGEVLAEDGDKLGGERDSGLVFEQERETFAKLDDETGPELAREVDFDEADVDAGGPMGWSGTGSGHPGEDAQSAADW